MLIIGTATTVYQILTINLYQIILNKYRLLSLLRVSSAAAVYFFYQSMAVVINLPQLNLYLT